MDSSQSTEASDAADALEMSQRSRKMRGRPPHGRPLATSSSTRTPPSSQSDWSFSSQPEFVTKGRRITVGASLGIAPAAKARPRQSNKRPQQSAKKSFAPLTLASRHAKRPRNTLTTQQVLAECGRTGVATKPPRTLGGKPSTPPKKKKNHRHPPHRTQHYANNTVNDELDGTSDSDDEVPYSQNLGSVTLDSRDRSLRKQLLALQDDDEEEGPGTRDKPSPPQTNSREPLRPGDVIAYYRPMFRLGDMRGYRVTQVLGTKASKQDGCLDLANGDFLPCDTAVTRVGVYKKKEASILRHPGVARQIKSFRITTSRMPNNAISGFQKRVENLRQTFLQAQDELQCLPEQNEESSSPMDNDEGEEEEEESPSMDDMQEPLRHSLQSAAFRSKRDEKDSQRLPDKSSAMSQEASPIEEFSSDDTYLNRHYKSLLKSKSAWSDRQSLSDADALEVQVTGARKKANSDKATKQTHPSPRTSFSLSRNTKPSAQTAIAATAYLESDEKNQSGRPLISLSRLLGVDDESSPPRKRTLLVSHKENSGICIDQSCDESDVDLLEKVIFRKKGGTPLSMPKSNSHGKMNRSKPSDARFSSGATPHLAPMKLKSTRAVVSSDVQSSWMHSNRHGRAITDTSKAKNVAQTETSATSARPTKRKTKGLGPILGPNLLLLSLSLLFGTVAGFAPLGFSSTGNTLSTTQKRRSMLPAILGNPSVAIDQKKQNVWDELLSRFQGDFDNYNQVVEDRQNGLLPREGGGHEHIHCCLVPVTENTRLAAFYFDGDPTAIFRFRFYKLVPDLTANSVDTVLFTLDPALERVLRDCRDPLEWKTVFEEENGINRVTELDKCDVRWSWTLDPVQHSYASSHSKDHDGIHAIMVHGEAVVESQLMPGMKILIRDQLSLWEDELWIHDRGFDPQTMNFIYGNQREIPYRLERVAQMQIGASSFESSDSSDGLERSIVNEDLSWTLGPTYRTMEEYQGKLANVGGPSRPQRGKPKQ